MVLLLAGKACSSAALRFFTASCTSPGRTPVRTLGPEGEVSQRAGMGGHGLGRKCGMTAPGWAS